MRVYATLLMSSITLLASTRAQQIEEQEVFGNALATRRDNTPNEDFTFITVDAQEMMDNKGFDAVNDLVVGLNECVVDLLQNHNIVSQTKKFMDFATSPEWISTVEKGTRQEVVDALGAGLDPMSQKLLSTDGTDLAVTMPIEMIEWIKDTTILWIKNKGAGHTTTEAAIVESSTIFQLRQEIAEMRDYYDKQVKNYAQQINNMAAEIKNLKTDNQEHQDKILSLYNKINDDSKAHEEQVQTMIADGKESEDQLNQQKDEELKRLTSQKDEDCKASKKALLKMLNKRYTESTQQLSAELTAKWKETQIREAFQLKKQITDLQTIKGGIRLDIKMDEQSGKYQISDADQVDDAYDLDSKMFEFTRSDEGEVLYQFVEKTKADVCQASDKDADDEKQKSKDEDQDEGTGKKEVEKLKPHKKIDFGKRCSGLFHKCDECGKHEALDQSEGGYRCDGDHFCFTYDDLPHCGDCKQVFGIGCKYCNYKESCLSCMDGFWNMAGMCVPKPW